MIEEFAVFLPKPVIHWLWLLKVDSYIDTIFCSTLFIFEVLMLQSSNEISEGSGGSSATPLSKIKKQRRARQWYWGSTLCQQETLSKENQGRVKP